MMDAALLPYKDLLDIKPSNELKDARGIIYCIWNKVTDRRYIGKTKNTFSRRYDKAMWWRHTKNKELLDDYNKYGPDSFIAYILEKDHTDEELAFLEAIYIHQFNTIYPIGYNMTYFDGPNMSIQHHVPAAVQNSLKGKQRKLQQDTSKGVVKKKRTMTAEFCAAASEHTKGVNNPRFGVKLSDETKEKIRIKRLGYKVPKELAAVIGLKMRGSKHGRSKTVQQIDINTGQVIHEFGSAREASRAIKRSPSGIVECCNQGRQTECGGFHWRYKT